MKMKDRGVFVTWNLFRNKNLTISEKFILLEIHNLSMLDKGCVASNSHFSEIMGIKKEAVSRLINSLVKKKFINAKIKNGSRNFARTITLNKLLLTDNNLLFNPKQIVISPLTNCLETKENKTYNKTESNSAHHFLQNNYQERWNIWQIQNKKQIENYDKFLLDFDDKVTIEKLEFEANILFARINTYARNWIQNTTKSRVRNLSQELPVNHPSLRMIK